MDWPHLPSIITGSFSETKRGFVSSSFLLSVCADISVVASTKKAKMTDTRAKKSGIGHQIEQKMEASYDQLEADKTPEHIQLWISAVLAGEEDCQPTSFGQRDLHNWLKSGAVLCKLINKLLASQGKSPVPFKQKAANTFAAFGNIEHFNKGCTDYGMKKEDLVQSVDLWEGRKGPFVNVINTLHSLGMKANAEGFAFTYTGQQTKYLED